MLRSVFDLVSGRPMPFLMNIFPNLGYLTVLALCWLAPILVSGQVNSSDNEPVPEGDTVIELIDLDSFKGWKVPSDCWSIKGGVIFGRTGSTVLKTPQWLYTEQRFADFVFTCEVKLTGARHPNSGIYYRVNPIRWQRGERSFEAASGYEFDIAHGKFNGSLGDWYARPKLRIWPDPDVLSSAFKQNEWNRLTIRARGNHLEYWMNGTKIIDYRDDDPNGSREGCIGLQIHDNAIMEVALRSARICPL